MSPPASPPRIVERLLELSPGPPLLPIAVGALAEAVVSPGDLAARFGAALFGAGLGALYVTGGRSVVAPICARLRFSNDERERITHLVRHHLFHYDQWSDAAVRRWLRRVGPDLAPELYEIGFADARVVRPLGRATSPTFASFLSDRLAKRQTE